MAASGIPRIEIKNENAMFDYYINQLREDWMRRIKLAGLNKGRVDSNRSPRPPEFRRGDARPTSMPPLKNKMEITEERRDRGRRRPLSGKPNPSPHKVEGVRAKDRPRSAHTFGDGTTAAWATVRGRNCAAVGPGPTFARRGQYHGLHLWLKTPAVRPTKAHMLDRRPQHNAEPQSRERSKLKHHAFTKSNPRVNDQERDISDPFPTCRKAATRDKGSPPALSSYGPRSEQLRPGEKIEDLGRRAVIRFILDLGMARYAHRFRAFAVTGADLAVCTEDDLAHIGVSFRPHRFRLLTEIERRRGRQSTANEHHQCCCKTVPTETATISDDEGERMEPLVLQLTQKPLRPELEREALESTMQADRRTFFSRGTVLEDASRWESRTRSSSDEDDELREKKHTARAFSRDVEHAWTLQVRSFEPEARQDVYPQRPNNYSQTLPWRPGSAPGRYKGGRFSGEKRCGFLSKVQASAMERVDSRSAVGVQTPVDVNLAPFTSPSHARVQTDASPRFKGTLQVFGVRAGNVTIALGTAGTFLRVRTCNQQRQTNAVGGKGVEVHWGDAVLSFDVTDRALAAGGVQVELCDRGTKGAHELVASGSIPGDFTLDLICGSDSGGRKADDAVPPFENAERGDGGGVTRSRVSTVEVRLFAKDGGKDAGVCALNLSFRPDTGLHPVVGPETNTRQDELSGAQPLSKDESRAAAAARASGLRDIRLSSISLFEETAKHVRAIEEVRFQFHNVGRLDGDGGEGESVPPIVTPEAPTLKKEASDVINASPNATACEDPRSYDESNAVVVPQSRARSRGVRRVVKRRPLKEQGKERTTRGITHEEGHSRQRLAEEEQHRLAAKLESFATCRGVMSETDLLHRDGGTIGVVTDGLAASEVDTTWARSPLESVGAPGYENEEERRAAVKLQTSVRRRAANKKIGSLRKSKEAEWDRQAETLRERREVAKRIQHLHRQRSTRHDLSNKHIESTVKSVTRTGKTSTGDRDLPAMVKDEESSTCIRRAFQGWRSQKQREEKVAGRTECAPRDSEAKERVSMSKPRRELGTLESDTPALAHREATEFRHRQNEADMYIQRPAKEDLAIVRSRGTSQELVDKQRPKLHVEEGEEEEEAMICKEAASHVQRAVLSRQAPRRVATLKDNRELDIQRQLEAISEALRHEASSCIQRLVRCHQARCRTMVLEKRREAAVCIQRAMRCRQARDRKAALRRQRDGKIRRKREEAEVERRRVVKTEAAECIQRKVRSRQARKWVAAVRQQRNIDTQRKKEEKRARGRTQAAECIQRAVRCHQAVGRVSELRRQEGIRRRVELEREQSGAAALIKRAVRCRQARDCTAVLRWQRVEDMRRKQEEDEAERRRVAEAEAAECIQRKVRGRQAVGRVVAVRQQRNIDTQRKKEEQRTRRRTQAAECIQRAVRCHQAVGRVSELRRQEGIRRRVELEREQSGAAALIQRAVRCRQARDCTAVLRWQRDEDMKKKQEEDDTERRRMAEVEAAECIQRKVRSRQARRRVAAVRQQRNIDTQRKKEEERARRRTQAAECIQRAVRCHQAVGRVSELRRQEGVRSRVELQREQSGAAALIQRAVRCRQARDCTAVLRWQRVEDMRRKQEEDEAERRRVVKTEAAECIQRKVRGRQAVGRVAAVRQQRNIDTQRKKEEQRTRRRTQAAECIQRAVRFHQAVGRVSELRRQEGIRRRVELEREQSGPAALIQRAVRCRQARDCTAVLRWQRVEDMRRKQEEDEAERRRVAETEAAECIQRKVRGLQARRRVVAVRQQRNIDTQRKKEEERARRRTQAAECIQRAVMCHQAVGRVSELRRQWDTSREAELEPQRGEAIFCIQRAVRCRQARDCTAVLQWQRDEDMKKKQEEDDTERRRVAEAEAAECIQRKVRSRQARRRVAAVRQQRNIDTQRKKEEEIARERTQAVECIQRAVRCHQAVGRVSELRRQEGIRRRVELQREQSGPAALIQRAVRCRQARDRTAVLRWQRVEDMRRKQEEDEAERRRVAEAEAAECIQCKVRGHQARRRVVAVRQQRNIDTQRKKEEEIARKRTQAAECIQRAARCHQAVGRVSELRRQWDTYRKAELERQRGEAIFCIQRAVRCRQARDCTAVLRWQRDEDMKKKQEEDETERRRMAEVEAAKCIQRKVHSRQARKRVAAVRQQRNIDTQRKKEEERARRRTQAAECIQRAVRCHQAVGRVSELRRQEGVRRRVGLQREQSGAAARMQRAVRCRQARDCTAVLRWQRVEDMRRKQEEDEAERRRVAETEAAKCIQRKVRGRQARRRVIAVRQQRDANMQRELEKDIARRRAEAAECIQRAVRCHQAVVLVSELRLQEGICRRVELEREQGGAAALIQRAVRCRKARNRTAVLRWQRVEDMRRKQEEGETERRRVAETEAAECIQRRVRSRQAMKRVAAVRQQRDANMQRKQEEEARRQTVATECIQCACHQAINRVSELRKQRQIHRRAEIERARRRNEAAECIQRAVRCDQAVVLVSELRRQEDIRRKEELEREQGGAASCIQRVVRCRQARDRTAVLRWHRGEEMQQKREEDETERRQVVDTEAAKCIQRAARCRQATRRVAIVRQQRDENMQRKLEEDMARRQAVAAECIQRAVRCHQAVRRVSELQRQRNVFRMMELDQRQGGAASCIQRAVRCRQSRDRAADLRLRRKMDEQYKAGTELERRRMVEAEAAECIQRVVRRRKAVRNKGGLEPDGTFETQPEDLENEEGKRATGGGKKDFIERQGTVVHQQDEAEKEMESVSSMFTRMVEIARQRAASNPDMTVIAEYTSIPEKQTTAQSMGILSQEAGQAKSSDPHGIAKGEDLEGDEKEKFYQKHPSEGRGAADAGDAAGGEESATEKWVDKTSRQRSSPLLTVERARRNRGASDSWYDGEKSNISGMLDSSDAGIVEASPTTEQEANDREGEETPQREFPRKHKSQNQQEHRSTNHANDADDESCRSDDDDASSPAAQPGERKEESDARSNVPPRREAETDDSTGPSSSSGGSSNLRGKDLLSNTRNDQALHSDDVAAATPVPISDGTHPNTGADENPQPDAPLASGSGTEKDDVPREFSTTSLEKAHDQNREISVVSQGIPAGWETHVDKSTGRPYYYHSASGTSSWDCPRDDAMEATNYDRHENRGRDSARTDDQGAAGTASSQFVEDDGNARRGSRTYTGKGGEAGEGAVTGRDSQTRESITTKLGGSGTSRGEEKEAGFSTRSEEPDGITTEGGGDTQVIDDGRSADERAGEWQRTVDPATGSDYFYNPMTRQSAWELPEDAIIAAATEVNGAPGADTNSLTTNST